MILSDTEIRKAVEVGRIGVSPEPHDDQFQPATLDLRMGSPLHNIATGVGREPIDGTFEIRRWPNFYLGTTLESISLPNDIRGKMEGRSSFGREGLMVHITAGVVDPGWAGHLTFEIVNLGPAPVEVDVSERVAQIEFAELSSPSKGYDGRYQGQVDPTESRR